MKVKAGMRAGFRVSVPKLQIGISRDKFGLDCQPEFRSMTMWKSIVDAFKRPVTVAPEVTFRDFLAIPANAENGFSLVTPQSLLKTKTSYPATLEEIALQAAKRERLKTDLAREIHSILKPLGYKRTGNHWSKESDIGKSRLEFQKSTYGFDCYFNATATRVKPKQNLKQLHIVTNYPSYRIAAFCPEIPSFEVVDGLSYVRLQDDPVFKQSVLTVIRARMIPWMELAHNLSPERDLPAPADMVCVQIFG